MVELRVVVSDELAETLARRARAQHTTAEELVSQAAEAQYGTASPRVPRELGFIGLGRSGRSDVSERHEEIIRADFGR